MTAFTLIPGVTTEQYSYADVDVASLGAFGHFSIPVKVTGYWSSDPLRVHVSRHWEGHWDVDLSHSSGGRDTEAQPDGLIAECNFGIALMAAAALGSMIRGSVPVMEQAYQERRAEKRAAQEAEKAAKQDRIEADAPLGTELAKVLVQKCRAVLTSERLVRVNCYKRGDDEPMVLFGVRDAGDRIRFGLGYVDQWGRASLLRTVKASELVQYLADMSERTDVAAL